MTIPTCGDNQFISFHKNGRRHWYWQNISHLAFIFVFRCNVQLNGYVSLASLCTGFCSHSYRRIFILFSCSHDPQCLLNSQSLFCSTVTIELHQEGVDQPLAHVLFHLETALSPVCALYSYAWPRKPELLHTAAETTAWRNK